MSCLHNKAFEQFQLTFALFFFWHSRIGFMSYKGIKQYFLQSKDWKLFDLLSRSILRLIHLANNIINTQIPSEIQE